MLIFKNLEIPFVVLLFAVFLIALYGTICGVECCQECRHLRREQEYEHVPESTTTMNVWASLGAADGSRLCKEEEELGENKRIDVSNLRVGNRIVTKNDLLLHEYPYTSI